jgi:hypothetical protein
MKTRLTAAKEEMEKTIARCIGDAVRGFQQETGAGVISIRVNMLDVTSLSSPGKEFIPGGVRAGIVLHHEGMTFVDVGSMSLKQEE